MSTRLASPRRRRAATFLAVGILAVSATRADTLATWNAPLQTSGGIYTTPAPTLADGVVSSAIAIFNQGSLSPVGASTTAWRFGNWSNNPNAYFGFSVTAAASTNVVLENLFLAASLETTSGASWTNATLALSYSPTADFSGAVTSAGALALGTIGASATTSFVSSVAGTYFTTPLTIEEGETYHFRLRPTGASGFNARIWISAANPADITLAGTASAIPEPSAFACLTGGLAFALAGLRRRHRRA